MEPSRRTTLVGTISIARAVITRQNGYRKERSAQRLRGLIARALLRLRTSPSTIAASV